MTNDPVDIFELLKLAIIRTKTNDLFKRLCSHYSDLLSQTKMMEHQIDHLEFEKNSLLKQIEYFQETEKKYEEQIRYYNRKITDKEDIIKDLEIKLKNAEDKIPVGTQTTASSFGQSASAGSPDNYSDNNFGIFSDSVYNRGNI